MKNMLRALFLVALLAVTFAAHANAEGYVYACYVDCSGSVVLVYGPMLQSDCCGGRVAALVTCPGGVQGYAYGYEGGAGPEFC